MPIARTSSISLGLLVVALAAAAQNPPPAAPPAPAGSGPKIYPIDMNHTTIGFEVGIMGMSEVTGKFTDFKGEVVVPNETDLTKATVEVTIKTASINTGIPDRDKHLRTADFFDAAQYPEISFKSTKIQKVGENYSVTGDFTMRGVSKVLTIPFRITGHTKVIGARATLPLNRKDYGIAWSRAMDDGSQFVSDEVTVELRLLTRVGKTTEELAKEKAAKPAGG